VSDVSLMAMTRRSGCREWSRREKIDEGRALISIFPMAQPVEHVLEGCARARRWSVEAEHPGEDLWSEWTSRKILVDELGGGRSFPALQTRRGSRDSVSSSSSASLGELLPCPIVFPAHFGFWIADFGFAKSKIQNPKSKIPLRTFKQTAAVSSINSAA